MIVNLVFWTILRFPNIFLSGQCSIVLIHKEVSFYTYCTLILEAQYECQFVDFLTFSGVF